MDPKSGALTMVEACDLPTKSQLLSRKLDKEKDIGNMWMLKMEVELERTMEEQEVIRLESQRQLVFIRWIEAGKLVEKVYELKNKLNHSEREVDKKHIRNELTALYDAFDAYDSPKGPKCIHT
jgi:hypothetical protein